MKLQATDGRLVIEELPDKQEGLIVVVSADKQAKPWRVVSVGPNVVWPHGAASKCDFKVGDLVWVDLSMAYELSLEGKKYRVVEFPYVVAWQSGA